jgi:acetylornithine deacetylase/succinyl-diaminopimelate desuccinylase-like protein
VNTNRLRQRVDRAEIVSLAKELVAIPSPSGEERAVMEFVAGWCAARGLSHQLLAHDPDRPNVVVSIGDGGPTLVMNGHLDTVPVSDADAWRTDPFAPALSADGSRLFGRGASDMKSATAVMLYLMGLLADEPLRRCVAACKPTSSATRRPAAATAPCTSSRRSPLVACPDPTTA